MGLWLYLICLTDKTVYEHVAEPERNPENDKKLIEMQTFLMAYMTAKVSLCFMCSVPSMCSFSENKTPWLHSCVWHCLLFKMESNTAKLKAEAEARILQMMEEEHALHNEVQGKKRRYLLMEKKRTINDMLDLQVRSPFVCTEILWNVENHFNHSDCIIVSYRLLYSHQWQMWQSSSLRNTSLLPRLLTLPDMSCLSRISTLRGTEENF